MNLTHSAAVLETARQAGAQALDITGGAWLPENTASPARRVVAPLAAARLPERIDF